MSRYSLYIDESGTANINDYSDTFFVISGVLIEQTFSNDLSRYFTYLKRRYGIEEKVNFHAAEFFEARGNSLFNGIDDAKASQFSASLADFILTMPFKIIAQAINKDLLRTMVKIPEELRTQKTKFNLSMEDADIAYEAIARKLLFEFSSHLLTNDSLGSIVAESRRESDKVLLQSYLYVKEPVRFKQKPYYYEVSREASKRIISLQFENKSGLTGGLEIADIYSYLLYKSLHKILPGAERRGGLALWNAFSEKIEKPIHSVPAINGPLLSEKDIKRVASDVVNKISNRISSQLYSGTL